MPDFVISNISVVGRSVNGALVTPAPYPVITTLILDWTTAGISECCWNNSIFTYLFCDLCHTSEFMDHSKMTGWYFHQMLLLFKLAAYILASTDTEQCQVCQTPLIQNRQVLWWHLLEKKYDVFFWLWVQEIRPNLAKIFFRYRSFTPGTYTTDDSYYRSWIVPTIWFWLVLYFGVTSIVLGAM